MKIDTILSIFASMQWKVQGHRVLRNGELLIRTTSPSRFNLTKLDIQIILINEILKGEIFMQTLVLKNDHLMLPRRIIEKFRGKKIMLMETDEGVLLKPIGDAIKEARGILKGSRFNTDTYMKQKQLDKELEA